MAVDFDMVIVVPGESVISGVVETLLEQRVLPITLMRSGIEDP
jgi:hypothetical protein